MSEDKNGEKLLMLLYPKRSLRTSVKRGGIGKLKSPISPEIALRMLRSMQSAEFCLHNSAPKHVNP